MRGRLPSYRKVVGIGGAFIVLAFLAGPAPELAGALAVLTAVSVVIADGPVVFGSLTAYFGGTK